MKGNSSARSGDTFAYSGMVIDANTGQPIGGATVALVGVSLFPLFAVVRVTATTHGTGAFAFTNMPSSALYQLAIAKLGYGGYVVQNLIFQGDEQYVQQVELDSDAQLYDATFRAQAASAQAPQAVAAAAEYRRYTSTQHVPPTIKVRLIQDLSLARSAQRSRTSRGAR